MSEDNSNKNPRTNRSGEKKPPHAPKRVLVIAAHPDDVEFGMGGTIAKWTDEGAEIAYVLVTDGAAGSNEPGVNPHELARLREEEQAKAAAVLGVTKLYFLRHRDGELVATLELRRQLTRIIRTFKPDRVVAQDPSTYFVGDRYVNHPDHRAAGEAAIYAVFPSSESRLAFPELLDEGLEPHRVIDLWLSITLEPNEIVDISPYWDRKEKALREHASQIRDEAVNWLKERFKKLAEQYDTGAEYVEVFRVIRINEVPEDEAAEAEEGFQADVVK